MSRYATAEQRRDAAGIPKFAEPLDANLLLCILRHHELTGFRPTWDEMCRASGSGRALTAVKLRDLRDAGLIIWNPEAASKGTLRPTCTEVGIKPSRVARGEVHAP